MLVPMFSRSKQSAVIVALVVLVVGALLVGGLAGLVGGGGGGAESPAPRDETLITPLPESDELLALARRDADDPLALGDPDAPVVMIEYADFQCALCGRYARRTHPVLIEEYVATGVLRIEFRNYPTFGPESDTAARAAWAAGRQGRFWEFYTAVYAEDAHVNTGRFTEAGVRELAEQVGVPDMEQFAAELDSAEAGQAVGRDAEEAVDLGVMTSPSFLINGYPLLGAQPVAEFRNVIDQLYAAEQNT